MNWLIFVVGLTLGWLLGERVQLGYHPHQPWRQFDVHALQPCCWFSVTLSRFSLDVLR